MGGAMTAATDLGSNRINHSVRLRPVRTLCELLGALDHFVVREGDIIKAGSHKKLHYAKSYTTPCAKHSLSAWIRRTNRARYETSVLHYSTVLYCSAPGF